MEENLKVRVNNKKITNDLNEMLSLFNSMEYKWEENFEALEKFVNYNGKFPIYNSNNEEEKKLCIWINLQRIKYNLGKMSDEEMQNLLPLDKERYELLYERKFLLEEYYGQWKEYFEKWKTFVNDNGRYPLQTAKNDAEKDLGIWVNWQRKKYGYGKMSKAEQMVIDCFRKGKVAFSDNLTAADFISLTKNYRMGV